MAPVNITVTATLAREPRSNQHYPAELFLQSLDRLVSTPAENFVEELCGRVITVDLALAPHLGFSLMRLVRRPRATPPPISPAIQPDGDPWDATRHGLLPHFVEDAADAYRRSLWAPRYVVVVFTPSATSSSS